MARGKFPGMPPMGGGNMGGMMKQIQTMQKDMEETQAALKEQTYEATACGGAVTATISGEKKLTALSIAPEAVDPDDVEMLSDLIIAAVNEALAKMEEDVNEKMGRFTNGMNLNGLF